MHLYPYESILKDKKIGIVVTGTIGAIRAFDLARCLSRYSSEIHFVVSKAGRSILTQEVLEWSSSGVHMDVDGRVEYLSLGENLDLLFVFASADFISKLAHGISDDIALLTCSVFISLKKPVLLLPLMHKQLYRETVRQNLEKITKEGVIVVPPHEDAEKLKVPEMLPILHEISKALSSKPLGNRKIVVSLGRTEEKIDDVRIITNKASGLFGYMIALACDANGARVTVLEGNVTFEYPPSIAVKKFSTFEELESLIKDIEADSIYVSTVAVSDFKPLTEKTYKKLPSTENHVVKLTPRPKLIEKIECKKVVFSYSEKPKNYNCDLLCFVDMNRNIPGDGVVALEIFDKKMEKMASIAGHKSYVAEALVSYISLL